MKLTAIAVTIFSLWPLGPRLEAAAIVITNPGFEDPATTTFTTPVLGWTISGASSGGVWNINATPLGVWAASAPEGTQIGYAAGTINGSGPASLSQILFDSLAPHTIYTLSGQVGHPIGYGSSIGTLYTIELLAGSTVLASLTGSAPEGSFIPFSIPFDSTGSSLTGQALEIRLFSSQAQTAFDSIALDATQVPEPTKSAFLMLGAALCLQRRSRQKLV